MNTEKHTSVWDVLEEDPIKRENLKLRSALMIAITDKIEFEGLKQVVAAKRLAITQPRVSQLMQGKIEEFRLDTLVNFAHRLDLHITLEVAA